MEQQRILLELRKIKPMLISRFKIDKLALFGSYAKNTNNIDSDVDLVVFSEHRNYFDLIDMEKLIGDHLEMNIDLGYFAGMRTYIKHNIIKDLEYV